MLVYWLVSLQHLRLLLDLWLETEVLVVALAHVLPALIKLNSAAIVIVCRRFIIKVVEPLVHIHLLVMSSQYLLLLFDELPRLVVDFRHVLVLLELLLDYHLLVHGDLHDSLFLLFGLVLPKLLWVSHRPLEMPVGAFGSRLVGDKGALLYLLGLFLFLEQSYSLLLFIFKFLDSLLELGGVELFLLVSLGLGQIRERPSVHGPRS